MKIQKFSAKDISVVAMLFALNIVLTRFLSFDFPVIRISLGFLPLAVTGAMFGPVVSGISGGLADILGGIMKGYAIYPGFTLSALLSGAIYGIGFYKKEISLARIIVVCTTVTLLCDLALGTFWMMDLYGKGFAAIFPSRLLQAGVYLVLRPAAIYFTRKAAGKKLGF